MGNATQKKLEAEDFFVFVFVCFLVQGAEDAAERPRDGGVGVVGRWGQLSRVVRGLTLVRRSRI